MSEDALHARLIDVAPGRSGIAYATWLKAQQPEFIAGIEHTALDPFRGYATRPATSRPTRSRCSTCSTWFVWGPRVVDEVRHKPDPLDRIRGLLRQDAQHLTPRQ